MEFIIIADKVYSVYLYTRNDYCLVYTIIYFLSADLEINNLYFIQHHENSRKKTHCWISGKTLNYISTKIYNTKMQMQIHRKPGNVCQTMHDTRHPFALSQTATPHHTPGRQALSFGGGFPCDCSSSKLNSWFDNDTRIS